MPDYALVKAVNNPSLLREAKQVWAAAGRDPGRLFTDYRHFDVSPAPPGSPASMHGHWRRQFFRFVDRTYLEQYAPHIDLVEEANEYFTTQEARDPARMAPILASAKAAVDVWNGEFRGRTVTSPDGGQGTIPAECRLIIANGFVGNDIPRSYYELAVNQDAVLGYHAYTHWVNRTRDPGDWEFHAGRWHFMEQEYGLRPRYAWTECGPYAGTAEGWRHPIVLGGDVPLLVEAMRLWLADMARTPAYREGRIFGTGAWFTSGGPGWPFYELTTPELTAIAVMARAVWKSGVYSGEDTMDAETKAAILVHARAIEDLLEPPVPPVPVHDLRDKTNQAVINLFATAFGRLPTTAPPYIAAIGRALTTEQEQVLFANRAALYLGPAVELMTLTPAERAALIAALG